MPDRNQDQDFHHRSDDLRRQQSPQQTRKAQSGMEPPTFHGTDTPRRSSDPRVSSTPNKPTQPQSGSGGGRRGLTVDTSRLASGGSNDDWRSPRDVTMHDVGGGVGLPRQVERCSYGGNRRESIDGGKRTNPSPAAPTPTVSRTPSEAVATGGPPPAMPMDPLGLRRIVTAGERTMSFSEIFARVSDAYSKYQSAQMKLEQARIARNTRKDHFDTFPPIRERYQGAYDRAEEEFRKYKEEWSFVSSWTDTYFKALPSETDGEDTTSRKIQKELGSLTLDNYIEKVLREKLALTNWSKLSELQTQVQELQSNDQQRATEHAEYRISLAKIQTSCKSMESKQTYLNGQVEAVRKKIEVLAQDVTTVKQLAAAAVDVVGNLDKLLARVDQFEKDLKTATSMCTEVRNELLTYGSQQEALRQRIDALPIPIGPSESMGISLEDVRKEIDNAIEPIKKCVDESLDGIGEVVDNCARDIRQAQADIVKQAAQLERLMSKTAEVRNLAQADIVKQAAQLERLMSKTAEEVRNLHNEHTNDVAKISGAIAASNQGIELLRDQLVQDRNRIGGLEVAVRHCDDRLSNWSTNDYYEKVVNLLVARQPSWFDTCFQVRYLTAQNHLQRNQIQRVLDDTRKTHKLCRALRSPKNDAGGVFAPGPARNPFAGNAVVSNGVNGSAESRNGANVPSPPDWDRYERSLQYLTERNHNLAERIQKLEENDRVREELVQETRHESNVIARKNNHWNRKVYAWSMGVNDVIRYNSEQAGAGGADVPREIRLHPGRDLSYPGDRIDQSAAPSRLVLMSEDDGDAERGEKDDAGLVAES